MKNRLVLLLFSFVLIVFLSSCGDDKNPTEPGTNNNNPSTNSSGYPVPAMEAENVVGVLATISVEMEIAQGFPSVSIPIAFAQFGDGKDAGAVSVNGNSLEKQTQNNSTFYMYGPSATNPTASLNGVNFDGSAHSWTVSGSGDYPAINASVNSPRSFSFTSPAANSTVTKSSGLNLTWNGQSNNSKMLIVLAETSGSDYVYKEDINDSGSYSFSADDLKNISGQCLLQVVKYTYTIAQSGSKSYLLVSEIVKSATITIQ